MAGSPGKWLVLGVATSVALLAGSATAGATWLSPVSLSEPGQSAENAALAIDGSGNATVLWQRWNGAYDVVQSAYRPAGGSWQQPTNVSSAPSDAQTPQVSLDADGDATAVWELFAGTNSVVVQSAYRPAGGSWQAPVTLSEGNAGEWAPEPGIAVDAGGDAFAIWDRAGTIQTAYRPAGADWQSPTNLSPAGVESYTPEIAVDSAGDATAVWMADNHGLLVTETSYRPKGGTWETPSILSEPGEEAGDPVIAVDSRGDAAIAWGGPHRDLRVAYRPAGGAWEPAATLTEAGVEAENFPRLAIDGAGDVVAAWTAYAPYGGYARVQSSYRPAGGSWEAPVTLSNGEENDYANDVEFDALGDALTVWQSGGPTEAIYGDYRQAAGIWESPVQISEPGQESFDARVAFDPNGDAVAAWGRAGIIQAADAVLTDEAPAAATGAAQAGLRSATLNATVNPNGSRITECRFEYGTTPEYGHSAPCSSYPQAGHEPVSVSAEISGLELDTTYYYRVFAENSLGSSGGSGASFQTATPTAPAISSVAPDAGLEAGWTAVTITGTELGEATGVQFGSVSARYFTVNSPTSITAISPEGSGSVDVTVTNAVGTSAVGPPDEFTYVPPGHGPSITKLSTKTGPALGGSAVTITGTGFVGVTSVAFGSTGAASFTVTSPTSITAVAPPGTTGPVEVSVTTPDGTSPLTTRDRFTYGVPTVSGVSPHTGALGGGAQVTVTGSGFAAGAEATTFRFGKATATKVECNSSTRCKMIAPAAAAQRPKTVDVTATVAGKTSKKQPSEDEFSYV
jgi:hypothetical protein